MSAGDIKGFGGPVDGPICIGFDPHDPANPFNTEQVYRHPQTAPLTIPVRIEIDPEQEMRDAFLRYLEKHKDAIRRALGL